MRIESTLKAINEIQFKGVGGVPEGQTNTRLVGWPEVFMTDRVRLGRDSCKPGTYEHLHWHPIEACYYVISGHAAVRDVNGKEDEAEAGSIIYALPGIAGAHEWEVKRAQEPVDIRACNERPTAQCNSPSTRPPCAHISIWTNWRTARRSVSNRIIHVRMKLAAGLLALALGVTGSVPAHAQPSASSAAGSSARAYPERPVRVVVPLPAGGSTDTIVRALALRLTEAFGQTFVVDNRPGAGSLVGLDILASAAPDGYTLMAIGGTTVMYPLLYKSRHDIGRDFAPVAQLSKHGYVLVIHPSLPAKSVPEFVKHLKANPDKINYSSSGIGSPLHMSGELFKLLTGTRMTHVPYKGTAAAYADLLGGQVHTSFPTIISSRAYIRAERLRALAVTMTKRVSALPNVPTFEETGLNGMIVEGFYAIMAPQKTPQTIIERLAAEINKAMRTPEVIKSLAVDGAEAAPGSPAELAAHIKSELERWGKVIRSVGLKGQ